MTHAPTMPPPSPMDPVYDALGDEIQQRLAAAPDGTAADLSPVVQRLLNIPPARLARPGDAARFLHLLGFLCGQPGTDGRRAWAWARQVAAPHGQSADVTGLLAAVGDGLRQVDPSATDVIPPVELEQLFRRSMDLAPDRATVFGRAGLFHLHQGDDAAAERCLTRAFELDPASGFVARQLADLIAHAGRSADALAVLDRCVRAQPADAEPDPELLWQAGLTATSLERSEAAVGYFAQLEQAQPGRPWVAYYRAIGLLGLGRFAEAALAIEREAGVIRKPTALHVHTVRAAAAAGQKDVDGVRRHVDAAVRVPLSSVDYLAPAGVVGCFTRLWAAAQALDVNDTVLARLRDRVLSSGLTPAGFWEQGRSTATPVAGLRHFRVDLRQPVDERWAAAGHALPDAAAWPAYRIGCGVLATDEGEAVRCAVDWQRQSAPLPPVVESVVLVAAGPFTDRPGVVQRGLPEQMSQASRV